MKTHVFPDLQTCGSFKSAKKNWVRKPEKLKKDWDRKFAKCHI